MQESASMAGALLEEFRKVRRKFAEAYGVGEDVALEIALWGEFKVDKGRVDETSFRRRINAAGTSLGRNASRHISDQLAVLRTFQNNYKDDPDLDKETRDIEDHNKVVNTDYRFRNSQKKFRTDYAKADDAAKKEMKQCLLQMKNAPPEAVATADAFVKDNPKAIRFDPMKGAYLSPDANRDKYASFLRKFRGEYSSLKGSLLDKH